MDPVVLKIAREVRERGGRALVVGGYVRDLIIGETPAKDLDLEIYGLPLADLEALLSRYGKVDAVGRSFGVLKVHGLPYDFSVPRRDSKTGSGHRGFLIEADPSMTVEEAARRRDLTMNAMLLDPLTDEIIDLFGGRKDIQSKVLRAVDPATFVEDPLRGLRVAQFAARFEMVPDADLIQLMSRLDLSELPAERLFEEFKKMFLKGRKPGLGILAVRDGGLLRFFPEIQALEDCTQEPDWHPEGTVGIHTRLALDAAVEFRTGEERHDLALMLGVLCHDFGKPATTQFEEGRIRSRGHEEAGEAPARAFLERLKAPPDVVETVVVLVRYHLAPGHFQRGDASPAAYRRLARKLASGGASIELLERVSRSDHFGRTTPDALARRFDDGDRFLQQARSVHVEAEAPKDVVLGRHLIARGMTPGPRFGEILERCRRIQDETGWTDAEQILNRALSE
jgi:tRNA nucleotidyltransferase (CCA-adding enzyme)